jgi:hypothetical protein
LRCELANLGTAIHRDKESPKTVGVVAMIAPDPKPNENKRDAAMMIAEERDRRNKRHRRGLRGGTVAFYMLMTILLPALFPASGGANSPQEVVLSYDQAQRTLEVRITHASKDPATHYVKKVEIKKADKTIAATEYQSQPGQATFAYVYPVEIGDGDLLDVKVTCSVFGSKTVKLDMREKPR